MDKGDTVICVNDQIKGRPHLKQGQAYRIAGKRGGYVQIEGLGTQWFRADRFREETTINSALTGAQFIDEDGATWEVASVRSNENGSLIVKYTNGGSDGLEALVAAVQMGLMRLRANQTLRTAALQRTAAPQPKDGVALIADERRRQTEKEGWTAEHDDSHLMCELARAATAYLLQSAVTWPWPNGYKPQCTYMERLVKAGALIAAEIDRVQRQLAKAAPHDAAT